MLSPFLRIEINDKLVGESGLANIGTRCVLRRQDFAGDGPSEVLAIEDEESLTWQCARRRSNGQVHPVVAAARAQRVARIILLETKTTSYYREYRLRQPIVDGMSDGGIMRFTADPVIFDLARMAGPMRDVVNGVSHYTFTLADQTVEEIAQFIVDKAAAAGLSWLTLDQVDPDYEFRSFPIDRQTPFAAIEQLVDEVRQRDFACERRLIRTGDTGYALNLLSQFGAGVQTSPFLIKSGQGSVTHTVDASQQVTRAWPKGGVDPDGQPGNGDRARWIARNPDTGDNTFEIEDADGGAPPVAFDDQYVAGTAWRVYRVKTGETWTLVSTTAGPPAVIEVSQFPGIGSLADGEAIELRRTEPNTNDRFIRWGDAGNRLLERAVFRIGAIDGGTKEITIAQPWDDVDPVAVDGQFDGCRAELHTRIVEGETATAQPSTNSYNFATLDLPGSVQVGDWLIPATNSSVPYDAGIDDDAIATIDSIDGGTDEVTVSPKWRTGADPVTSSSVYAGIRIYRALRNDRVLATAASTNKLKLEDVTGLNVGDVVVLTRPWGAGELPAYVEHPVYVQAPPTGYGPQNADVDKPLRVGVQQLAPNAFQRTWGGSLPDGWTKSGAGSVTKNTDTDFAKLGPHSALIEAWTSLTYAVAPIYPALAPGRDRVSVRAWLWFTVFSDAAQAGKTLTLSVFEAAPDGTKVGTALGTAAFFAPDFASAPNPEQLAAVGGWVSIAVNGLELPPYRAPYGLVAELSGNAAMASNDPIAYVGGIEAYGHTQCPEDAFELGDATTLVQAANRHLREFGLPERFDAVLRNGGVVDPGRRLDTALGGLVPLKNPDYDIDALHRLVRVELAHFHPERSACAMTRRRELLTDRTL